MVVVLGWPKRFFRLQECGENPNELFGQLNNFLCDISKVSVSQPTIGIITSVDTEGQVKKTVAPTTRLVG